MQYTKGPFTADVNPHTSLIVLRRGSEAMSIHTGEGANAKSAISMGASLFNIPVLPEYVSFSPFKLHFLPDGATRLEKPEGGVSFSQADYEDLIDLIQMSVVACSDTLRLSGGARAGGKMPGSPDPII